jgi:glucose/arabinose dehydrogenase/PKD repeat protein
VRPKWLAACLALLAVSPALSVVAAGPARAVPTLPAGFRFVGYPTGLGAGNLTDHEFTPDGGLMAVGKNGRVVFVPADGTAATIATVPGVSTTGDHGLIGMTLARDYAETGRVFLHYPQLDGDGTTRAHGVLTEWRAGPPSRPTSLTRQRTIIDGDRTSPRWTQNSLSHSQGTVLEAPDGSLFVGNGDESSFSVVDPAALRTYDLGDPHGKILRVLPDGRGHPGNPFYDAANPSSWRSRVFAYGFRNPFRFTIDPRSGLLYVGDVGWGDTEEIDVVQPGRNYGWPCYEGTARQAGYAALAQCQQLYARPSQPAPPLWTYAHSGSDAAVVGGIFYQGSAYPAAYRGAYFFGDYASETLWTLTTDSSGRLTRRPEPAGFGRDVGGPVAFRPGPNGDVTYANIITGNVQRIVYAAGNREPTAAITATVDATTRTVRFSAESSYDLDGDPLTYAWDFGDGSTASGVSATHRYAAAGTFTVGLTVTDRLGAAGTATATVVPDNFSPTLTLAVPDRRYAVGDTVAVTATAADPEDGDLTAQVSWSLSLMHCAFEGSCHAHPEGDSSGSRFQAPFTDHGSDTTMVVTASVTDSRGATATQTYEATPDLHTLAVRAPVPVRINGVERVSLQAVTGSTNSVDAPASSSYWRYVGWSDGGAPIHNVTMPAHDLEVTARYRTAIAARYAELGGTASHLGAPTAAEYDVESGRARTYQRGQLYWSAATGVHWVRSGIWARFLATGGPRKWGFPTTDEHAVSSGSASHFQKGHFYWSRPTGVRSVQGGILAKYLASGGVARWGFPTTDQHAVAGGWASNFQRARIYYTRATGARYVRGGILTRYLALRGPAGRLGFPRSDQDPTSFGAVSRFQGGRIEWYRATNTLRVVYS